MIDNLMWSPVSPDLVTRVRAPAVMSLQAESGLPIIRLTPTRLSSRLLLQLQCLEIKTKFFLFSGQGGKGASDGEQGAPRGERQGGEQRGRGDH